jgi:hypothetical protein
MEKRVILNIVLAIFCMLLVWRDIRKSGYKIVLNPVFYAVAFAFLYLVLPAFFVNEINVYYNWNLVEQNVLFSHVLVFLFVSPILVIYYRTISSGLVDNTYSKFNENVFFIKILWLLILLYSLFVLYTEAKNGIFVQAFIYDFTQDDTYKIKNLAYFFIFIPNIILIILDLSNGSRTVAIISLAPIIISLCVKNQRLYLLLCLTGVLSFLALGIYRLGDGVEQNIPWYIRAIGEFRETYITLPLFVTNEAYIGAGEWHNAAGSFFQGILQPLRGYINESYIFSGTYISNDLALGYGLGSNFLVTSLYYGIIFVPITFF